MSRGRCRTICVPYEMRSNFTTWACDFKRLPDYAAVQRSLIYNAIIHLFAPNSLCFHAPRSSSLLQRWFALLRRELSVQCASGRSGVKQLVKLSVIFAKYWKPVNGFGCAYLSTHISHLHLLLHLNHLLFLRKGQRPRHTQQ
jgi:hypothetical protein